MNAKKELLDLLAKQSKVRCALITHELSYDDYKTITLKEGYSTQDFSEFISEMDFNYDNGFGLQELDGTIWLMDGTWCTREEYDGSEWWRYNKSPTIPEILKK